MKNVIILACSVLILSACNKTKYYLCECGYYDHSIDSMLWTAQTLHVEEPGRNVSCLLGWGTDYERMRCSEPQLISKKEAKKFKEQ